MSSYGRGLGLLCAYFASIRRLISGMGIPRLYMSLASSEMFWQIAHPKACWSV